MDFNLLSVFVTAIAAGGGAALGWFAVTTLALFFIGD